jgi:hypothetical protein
VFAVLGTFAVCLLQGLLCSWFCRVLFFAVFLFTDLPRLPFLPWFFFSLHTAEFTFVVFQAIRHTEKVAFPVVRGVVVELDA